MSDIEKIEQPQQPETTLEKVDKPTKNEKRIAGGKKSAETRRLNALNEEKNRIKEEKRLQKEQERVTVGDTEPVIVETKSSNTLKYIVIGGFITIVIGGIVYNKKKIENYYNNFKHVEPEVIIKPNKVKVIEKKNKSQLDW